MVEGGSYVSFRIFGGLLRVRELRSIVSFLSLLRKTVREHLRAASDPREACRQRLFLLLLFPVSIWVLPMIFQGRMRNEPFPYVQE